MGRQGPGWDRSTPGVLRNGQQLKKRRQVIFQASNGEKQEESAQQRSLLTKRKEEAKTEGATRSKDNRGKRKRHPKETRSHWLKKKSYIRVAIRHSSEEQKMTKGEEALELATF
ncbi:hypothetical protein NDU88_001903 [Pleurodeles waltl]|uniref:Uncharacterized protein n=1 Tax=Pleurodeles waltl TaxID=8319 RepID=A0AAV7TJ47_PLEWA|nr:hypothetical protein NDU88_001903 [Pleurodeles waltl]